VRRRLSRQVQEDPAVRETRSIREVMAAEPVAPPTERNDQPGGAAAGGGPRATSQVADATPDERGQAATTGPPTTREAPASAPRNGSNGRLVGVSIAQDLRTRWEVVQTGFVDEPRQAVQQADPGTGQPRTPVGPRRRCLDRRAEDRPAALPRLLRAHAVHVRQQGRERSRGAGGRRVERDTQPGRPALAPIGQEIDRVAFRDRSLVRSHNRRRRT